MTAAGSSSDEFVSSVLVYRDEPIALADRRWASAQAGAGHLLLVAGEAGIGKSRFLAEVVARTGSARHLVAHCWPRETAVGGALLFDLADRLRRQGETDVAARVTERLRSSSPTGDPARQRRLLVNDLAELVVELLGTEPTLFTVEDLQWADDISLDVLDHLAERLPDTASLVLATYRSDELFAGTRVAQWRAALLARRRAEEVRLNRLPQAQTAVLIEAIRGDVPSTDFVAAVQTRSDGIPLHIEELLHTGDDDVPASITEAVAGRMVVLDATAVQVAAAASVIGRTFDASLLTSIMEAPAEELDRALEELRRDFLVTRRADDSGYDFRHALICDAVYAGIPTLRRRALHASVARAAVTVGLSDAYVSEQFERAGENESAHRYALAAAAAAQRVSAHREAAALFRRAQRTAPRDQPVIDAARLHENLGVELGAIDEIRDAARELEAAIALYRESLHPLAAARLIPRYIAVLYALGSPLEERVGILQDTLDTLPDGAPTLVRAELLGAIATAYMLHRRLEDAISYGERAVTFAAESDEPATHAEIESNVGSTLVFAGQPEQGWAMLEHAAATAREAGAEQVASHAFQMAGSTASVVLDYAAADRWIAEGLEYSKSVERWRDHHYLVAHEAHVAWATGRLAMAESRASRAIADSPSVFTRATALTVRGYVLMARGQLAGARTALDEALVIGDQLGEVQRLSPALWGLAEAALLGGDPAEAATLARRAFDLSAAVTDAAYLFPLVTTGARALVQLRDLAAARDWLEACAALLRARNLPGTLAALDHAEGLVLLAERRLALAREHLEAAEHGWRDRNRFWERGRALVDLARCAAGSRRPADAARHLAEVRVLAEATGASALLTLADDVTADRDAHLAGGLSARELEVARLVAEGATNRVIAERLVLSPKTVSTHIEHILAKLEMARRAEIAAWVSRR